jgi:hypothetical protein
MIFISISIAYGNTYKKELIMKTSELIKKIDELPELALPDEWYLLDEEKSVLKKLKNVALKKAELSLEDMSIKERVKELQSKYCNLGNPFKHTVHFNQPVSVDFNESSFLITIISCEKDKYVSIKAIDFLKAKKFKIDFPAKELEGLNSIF